MSVFLLYNQIMKDTYIINTHSHANMLRQTNIDEAIKNAQNKKIITIVPSSTAEDIFEVDISGEKKKPVKARNLNRQLHHHIAGASKSSAVTS